MRDRTSSAELIRQLRHRLADDFKLLADKQSAVLTQLADTTDTGRRSAVDGDIAGEEAGTDAGFDIAGETRSPGPVGLPRGSRVELHGVPGPGITPEILRAAEQFVDRSGAPLVILGSRQTGVSEKSGQWFGPDSDLDIGSTNFEGLMQLIDLYESNSIDIPMVSGPFGVFSQQEAVERGYLVVLPRPTGR